MVRPKMGDSRLASFGQEKCGRFFTLGNDRAFKHKHHKNTDCIAEAASQVFSQKMLRVQAQLVVFSQKISTCIIFSAWNLAI